MKRISIFRVHGCMSLLLCGFVLPIALTHRASAQISSGEYNFQFHLDTPASPAPISCVPSNNDTGHLICAQQTAGGAMTGVSWVALPGTGLTNPGHQDGPNGPISLGNISGTLGVSSCANTSDNTGYAICATSSVVQVNSTTADYTLKPFAFFPPAGTASLSGGQGGIFASLSTSPQASTGPAVCTATAAANPNLANIPPTPAICVLVALSNASNPSSGSLLGAAIDPRSGGTNTSLVPLNYGSTFSNAISCATPQGYALSNGNSVAACAVVQGNNLIGFVFDPRTDYFSNPVTLLTTGPFQGNPSCAAPNDNSGDVICVIAERGSGSNTLEAVAFTPMGPAMVGKPQPIESVSGNVAFSCKSPNAAASNAPNSTGTNTIECVLAALGTTATSSALIDPRPPVASQTNPAAAPILGHNLFAPASNIATAPSCITLGRDTNQVTCAFQTVAPEVIAFTAPLTCPTVFMEAGATLTANQSISSCHGNIFLLLQNDGNLVLYEQGGTPIWATGTQGTSPGELLMQTDGNLVLYASNGSPLWSSGTQGNPGDSLAIQDDGNLVIFTANGFIWASNTSGH
jgi:hypothetical protein